MTILPFLITGALLVAAIVTGALYKVGAANAQTKTKTMTGPNMPKTANMTAGGRNMTLSGTASADNLTAYSSECLKSSCDLF